MPGLCSITGCGVKAVARGWCQKHYARWDRHGDPLFVYGRLEPPVGMRWCPGCQRELPIADFTRRLNYCRPCHRKQARAWALANPDIRRQQAARYSAKLRAEVLAAYGGRCVCCGESTPEFLAVDHVYNDGVIHRRSVNGAVYVDLRRRGFPRDGFQLLCHNCNMAKQFYGGCPHARVASEHS